MNFQITIPRAFMHTFTLFEIAFHFDIEITIDNDSFQGNHSTYHPILPPTANGRVPYR